MIKPKKKPAFNLENIIAHLPAHVYWLDTNNIFIGCNEQQAKTFGLKSRRDVVGLHVSSFQTEENAEKIISINNRVMKEDLTISVEEPFLTPDNKELIFLSQKVPIHDEKGMVVGILGISLNISDSKEREISLIASKKKTEILLEKVISEMPSHVYWKDKEGHFLGCNLQQAKFLGFNSVEELIGKTAYDVSSEEEAKRYTENDQKVINSGIAQTLEEPGLTLNGEEVFFLSKKQPLIDENGNVIGILGISFDLTKEKNIEKENYKRLEEQLSRMNLLTSSIAHELRTPLAGISLGATGILAYLPDLIAAYQLAKEKELAVKNIPPQQLEKLSNSVERIKNQAQNANLVINMLLTNLSEWRSDRKRDTGELSMVACIQKALDQYVFPPDKRALVHEDLRHDFLFAGNETLFIHILFNLLKNAFYFMDKAQKGEIFIWMEEKENHNELHFKDTGRGILPADLNHIFDQFFTKDTHHGTGIGLAFCKTVMESWGAQISCLSVYGEFAEFILKFTKINK